MGSKFASGQNALAICDRCGFRFRAKQLNQLIIKTKNVNLLVCGECYDPDQPQLQTGMFPIEDPQALRNPRPDSTYIQAGTGPDGQPTQGSRIIEWGWAPVGGSRFNDVGLTPNNLALSIQLGTVTVVTT
jgi:hypothetical protein